MTAVSVYLSLFHIAAAFLMVSVVNSSVWAGRLVANIDHHIAFQGFESLAATTVSNCLSGIKQVNEEESNLTFL